MHSMGLETVSKKLALESSLSLRPLPPPCTVQRAAGASPFGWNLLRRIQPGGTGDWFWVAVHLLVALGALCGTAIAQSYSAEKQTCFSSGCAERNLYNTNWRVRHAVRWVGTGRRWR